MAASTSAVSDVTVSDLSNAEVTVSEIDSDEDDAGTSSGTASASVSILDRLRAPKPSELARKRKVAANPPPRGKRACKSTNVGTTPVHVKPQQRVTEFPGENLIVSNGKLFCQACREELNMKKSSVRSHVQSSKHKESKNNSGVIG